jgi:ACS family hexuronate transporter-like MFS transporter
MPAAASRSSIPAWCWSVTGLLLLATTINYMDRVTLASASVRITNELGLSETQYGNLELAFGWSFAVGSVVFGFLADRLPIYLLYPAVLFAWSAMGAASGLTEGHQSLLICRALLGFFESAHWPCALKTTYTILSNRQRTLGNSILQSGASIGAILTPQLMRILLTDAPGSWRKTFVVVGALGAAWCLGWFLLIRPRDLEASVDSTSTPYAASESAAAPAPGLGAIIRSKPFWAVALLIVGAQTVWHVFRVWLMKFLQTGRGYPEAAALNFNSLYFAATDVGCILAGLTALALVKHLDLSPHTARRRVYAGACVLTSLSLLLPFLSKGVPLLCTLLVIGAGALALFPCYYSFVQDLSATHVGRLTGILSLWVWALTSPLHALMGAIADWTKSYDPGLMIAGLMPWIGVVSLRLLWKNPDAPGPAPGGHSA